MFAHIIYRYTRQFPSINFPSLAVISVSNLTPQCRSRFTVRAFNSSHAAGLVAPYHSECLLEYFWSSGATESLVRFLDRARAVGLPCTSDWLFAESATYKTYNKQRGQTSVPSTWFEPTVSAIQRTQTDVSYRTATGIGYFRVMLI